MGGGNRGVVLVQVGGGDEKRGEKKLDWVEMGHGVGTWGGDGVGAAFDSASFSSCFGDVRRAAPFPAPPPHRKIKLMM